LSGVRAACAVTRSVSVVAGVSKRSPVATSCIHSVSSAVNSRSRESGAVGSAIASSSSTAKWRSI
jgi:hypothetical protein